MPPLRLIHSFRMIATAVLGFITAHGLTAAEPAPVDKLKQERLIVLADMGNEPDEDQQILHLLMCANEVQLDGLLAVTGKFLSPHRSEPYKRVTHPELLLHLIDGYELVLPHLRKHAAGWQTPEELRRLVLTGQAGYGMEDVGDGKSSAGSRHIIAVLTQPDPRPVHIVINAGSNTLAQALWDYRATHTPQELAAFVAKLRVYENQAQDNAGAWICHEFPSIHWIRSCRQTRGFGGPDNKNLGPQVWKPFPYTPQGQDDWAKLHIRTGHGALGERYPARFFADKVHFIEGGGTIPWMRLVSPGLTDVNEPSWGGWSGRFSITRLVNVPSPFKGIAPEEAVYQPYSHFSDSSGITERWTDPEDGTVYDDGCTPVLRWRRAMWNDFQARMDWCVKPYAEANHHPRAVLNGDAGTAILRLNAKPGASLTFSATGSSDPDQDALRFSWWIYPEAGRAPYGKALAIADATAERITCVVPADAVGRELHLILEVWDRSPIVPLVAYRRAVITVQP